MSTEALCADLLRLRVDPASLGFADTSDLEGQALPWIGQERAEQAARFGLRMTSPDYNLFVLGEAGTGRSTLMLQMMEHEAADRAAPPDLCYLYNFDAPERPRALRLPAGEGRQLRQMMGDFARMLQVEIPKRLAAPDVQGEHDRIAHAAKVEDEGAFAELRAFAQARHFTLVREEGRMVFTQSDADGRPLTPDKALALGAGERIARDADETALTAEIARFQEASRARELAMDEQIDALERRRIKPLVERALQDVRSALRKQIKDSVKLGQYLAEVQQDMLENLSLFQPGGDGEGGDDEQDRVDALIQVLSRLRVNVAVDHHGRQGAPVVVDDNPHTRSLFGGIDYEAENDVLVTDFTRVRAGSLLKAHGGFLLLRLHDLLSDRQAWERLRRFVRCGRLQIEEPGLLLAPVAAVSLQPEPVDVDVKIVLLASVEEYYAVQEGDPEFARRFRCKVDFAESFSSTPEVRQASAAFVAHSCRQLGLPHCSAAAVAALIEASHREAQDQTRQSAVFAHTQALLVEGAAMARGRGSDLVEAADIEAAQQARLHRHDYPEQRLQEAIRDGERLMTVSGERVGQLNGLTVVDLGDHAFGLPVRVTASAHAGDEGLLNIEREVEMSGPIHDKGVLILQSHLCALFAHIAPLALNAAVVFEQEYSGVEGDSASCAEFYALLSALSGLPLRQGIAATGALNQHGDILPVGGINEKIEGYFRTCQALGLDGGQGVLIPRRNQRHLMLAAPVVQAVAQGRFHIHVADHVGEGMALLTGHDFGALGPHGYAADTVLGRAQRTLQAWRLACEPAGPRAPSAARRRLGRHRPGT